MVASLMLLIATMFMMSCARRVSRKSGIEVVPGSIIAPMMHQGPMINIPVATRQHLQVQPSSFPAVWSNTTDKIFPIPAFPTADANDTRISQQAPVTYNMDELDRARLGRARQLVNNLAVQVASTELLDTPLEPSSTGAGRATGTDTVQSLELKSFLGHWYQMYGSSSSTILESGGSSSQDMCTVTDYNLNADSSTINVLNRGIRPDGQVTKMWGYMKATDLPGEKKLSLHKFSKLKNNDGLRHAMSNLATAKETPEGPAGLIFRGDYSIYHLGPIKNDKYQYAIIGSPLSAELGPDQTPYLEPSQQFVLARNPIDFDSNYNDEVREWFKLNGFDTRWKKVLATEKGWKHWIPE